MKKVSKEEYRAAYWDKDAIIRAERHRTSWFLRTDGTLLAYETQGWIPATDPVEYYINEEAA